MQVITTYLKAALLAAGNQDVRIYLNGVMINARHIVATDGHRMHLIPHGGQWPFGEIVIPRQAVELALKLKLPALEVTPVAIGSISYLPLDGKFPDYTRVMANLSAGIAEGPIVSALNIDHAKDAAAAIRLVSGKTHQYLAFNGTAWVWSSSQLQIVVMPQKPTSSVPVLTSLEPVL